jgi:hypothetical protein
MTKRSVRSQVPLALPKEAVAKLTPEQHRELVQALAKLLLSVALGEQAATVDERRRRES